MKLGFLDLPPEIRTVVYRHLLVRHKRILWPQKVIGAWLLLETIVPKWCWGPLHRGHDYDLQSAILATCKTIYQEALPVLYGENVFGLFEDWIYDSYRLEDTLKDPLGSNFSLLKNVYIELDRLEEYPRPGFHSLLTLLSDNHAQLDSLTIDVEEGLYAPGESVRDSLRDIVRQQITKRLQLRVDKLKHDQPRWQLTSKKRWHYFLQMEYEVEPILNGWTSGEGDFVEWSHVFYEIATQPDGPKRKYRAF
ncbi:uncharacterized protein KY384_007510 [Bacidia gigantensis]|uniref:uncharacterized protein n=1 Tax=Bacidia gigantensis TaxID=2732470 RepID=UPI001D03C0D7|nr:uncharacterized protein KY384_007510 [Bacidia gigantensis]KAG8527358.1 hypothetical protein KY384_007510 [Bacidia gigantensis]